MPQDPPRFSWLNKRDLISTVKVMSPLLFVFGIGLHFHEFVIHAVNANVAINTGIISAATFGAILIFIRLIEAQKDFRIIERFGYEASQGVYMVSLLDADWIKGRYVRHYLSYIANTGGTVSSEMEQSAIEHELEALQKDYDSRLELPQFITGFMIAMGLLGTFIGLLETLTGISGMLDGMGAAGTNVEEQFMKLVGELKKPLAGMGIAFSASMFGLITSLMLSIMMTNIRRYISRVISLARNVMHNLTEMTHTASSGGGGGLSPSEIDQLLLQEAVQTTAPMGGGGGGGGGGGSMDPVLIGRFDVLAKKIDSLLGAFNASSNTMNKLLENMGSGAHMREIAERTLEEIKVMADFSGQQGRAMQTLMTAGNDSANLLAKLVETQSLATEEQQKELRYIGEVGLRTDHSLAALLEAQKVSHQELQAALQSYIAIGSEGAKASSDLLETQKNYGDQAQRLLQSVATSSAEAARASSGALDSQMQARNEMASNLRRLSEQFERVQDAMNETARQTGSVGENVEKLGKPLEMLEVVAASSSGQSALLEALISEVRRMEQQLGTLHNDLVGLQSGGNTPT